MKLAKALSETAVLELHGVSEYEVEELCTSSREVGENTLFFGLAGVAEGARHGCDFARDAESRGALPVLDRLPDEPPARYVLVEDARMALSSVARTFYGHPERELKVVGVTGTKGKTTVTHLLKSVLEECTGKKVGLIGTNHVLVGKDELPSANTTPEAHALMRIFRQMADAGCTFAVMEVSSHSLCLHRVEGVRFAAAGFLNLTHDHLDFHKTLENYAAAKALIFAQADTAVINADADFASLQLEAARAIPTCTFSTTKNNVSLVAKDIRLSREGSAFAAVAPGRIERVDLPIPGLFSVYNALAVLGLANAVGVSLEDAACSLSNARGVPGRCETVETGEDFSVIVDYAHTPDSLQNILRTVRGFTEGRVLLVFGCGGERDRLKRPVMGQIAAEMADEYVVTSDNPRREKPEDIIGEILEGTKGHKKPALVTPDRREAIFAAIARASHGDTVVIAGKGHEDYQDVAGSKIHFDDRETAREALAARKEGSK